MEQSLQTLNAQQRMQVWSERITACRRSGKRVRIWCQENGISEKTYYYWQRRLFQRLVPKQETSCFAEVPVSSVAPSTAIAAIVHLGDAEAKIYSGADPVTVQTVLQALKSC